MAFFPPFIHFILYIQKKSPLVFEKLPTRDLSKLKLMSLVYSVVKE